MNVALATSSEWLTLQAKLFQALAPFPDAKACALAALEGEDEADPSASRAVAGQPTASATAVAATAGNGEEA